jgi:hypothetical protein
MLGGVSAVWRLPPSPKIQILAGIASAETPLPPEQRPAFLWAELAARSRLRMCHPGQPSMKPVACKPFLKRQLFSQGEYQLQNTVCVKHNIAYNPRQGPEWNAGTTKLADFVLIRANLMLHSRSFLTTDCTDPAAAGRIRRRFSAQRIKTRDRTENSTNVQ